MATKDIVKETMDKLGVEQTDEVKHAVEKLATDIFEKGMLPKDAMGLSDAMMEGMYSFGYRLYNTGKYEQAIQLFRLLVMLDPTQAKFSLGLAACFHMMKDYKNAATTYILCSIIDSNDPLPHYHASDCYLELNQPEMAFNALELCIERCNNRPEFSGVKDRAKITLDALRKQLKGEAPDLALTSKPEEKEKVEKPQESNMTDKKKNKARAA